MEQWMGLFAPPAIRDRALASLLVLLEVTAAT